jgi:hypothetical protein
VYENLIREKSRVYNFVARTVLDRIPLENAALKVELTIDKSKSRPEIVEFNSYIRRELESKIDPAVPFNIYHVDSKEHCGLQAVDMFSYAVFEKYERRRTQWYDIIKEKVKSVPYGLSMSKLMPTDGWEHFEQPITDSPLTYILMLLHKMSRTKRVKRTYADLPLT